MCVSTSMTCTGEGRGWCGWENALPSEFTQYNVIEGSLYVTRDGPVLKQFP